MFCRRFVTDSIDTIIFDESVMKKKSLSRRTINANCYLTHGGRNGKREDEKSQYQEAIDVF